MDLVIDGTDGAGKTPLVERLCARLRDRGRDVATLAPYRVEEVFPLWAREPRRAAAIITGIMRAFREAHPRSIIVWDRGWPTAWVSTGDAEAKRAFLPFPRLTVLLLNTTAVTRMRAAKHGSQAPWMTEDALIEGFNRAYRALPREAPEARIVSHEPDAGGRYDLERIAEDALERGGWA